MNPSRLIALLLAALPVRSHAAIADQSVLMHPGYTITIHQSGRVRIDFILNQKGIERSQIDSLFKRYPKEKVKIEKAAKKEVAGLFRLFQSEEFEKIRPEYLAPPGSFAYAGHRILFSLTVRSSGKDRKIVRFDSSRRKEWPEALSKSVDMILSFAESREPLPGGPFIN